MPAPKRGEILFRIARLLAEHKEELSRLMTREMGKVLPEARGDVQEAIDVAYYMAGEGRRLFGYTVPSEMPDKFAMAIRKPIGVAAIITPWNFPVAIPAWKLFPALICGNAAVLKPASDTPACMVRFVELLLEGGVPEGVVNVVLTAIGVGPKPWLTDPFWAKVLIILAITWRWTGYNMIFYLAALQNVDRAIYEVAQIDGVPPWARFWYITLPMLKPVILFTTVISTIGTLQLFDEPYNITLGGPSQATMTLSYYIYDLTFRFMPSFGYTATVSWVIVVLVGILSLIQFLVARERRT